MRFSSVEGDCEFYVDPVPRVITAADWEPVKRGLAQRVRALNAFVADVYGDQRIVAEGVVPPEVIGLAPTTTSRRMRGVAVPGGCWIGVAGLDLVRDHDGRVARAGGQRPHAERVRLPARHPARAARATSTSRRTRRRGPLDGEIDLLADALRAAAPEPPAATGCPRPRC